MIYPFLNFNDATRTCDYLFMLGLKLNHVSMRSVRGASEAMTSQWFNIRAPFNNNACVNNFLLFQARRKNDQWQPDKLHTRVSITTATTCDKKIESLIDILQMICLALY